MSLFDFLRGGARASATVSKSDLLNPRLWLVDALAGRRVAAGRHVSEADAMTSSTYFACVRNVSEDLAKLPLPLYRALDEQDRERVPGHDAARLLNVQFNPELDAQAGREKLTSEALRFGKGVAEIERDGSGRAVNLWPIPPELVRKVRDKETGRLVVAVAGTNGQPTVGLDPADVFWLTGPAGGLSIAQLAARDLGVELSAAEFADAFFENGTHVGGVLQHPKKLGKEALERLRETWTGTYAGPGKAGKPAILEDGMEWKATTLPLRDAQFLELRRFGVEVIARWFRMPPHKIGDLSRATYSNIEHQGLEYVVDTLHPWARRWELEAERKLLATSEAGALYFRHTFQALLRGDYKTRAEGYRALIAAGVMTPNEARALEDMNRAGDEGADLLWMQGAMRTVEGLAVASEPPPEEPEPTPEEQLAEDLEDDDEEEAPDDEGQAPAEELEDDDEEATARERFATAILATTPAWLDLAARIDSRETLAIRRQMKRDDFAAWLETWAEREVDWVARAAGGLFDSAHAIASSLGLELAPAFAPDAIAAIRSHVEMIKRDALGAAIHAHSQSEGPWASRRAGDQLTPAILAAIEKAARPAAGGNQ